MANLIITVIAIAFFAAVMFAGSGYVNFDSVTSLKDRTELTSSLSQLTTGIGTYRLLHEKRPKQWSDLSPGIIGQPSLPDNFWWGDLTFNRSTGYNEACINVELNKNSHLDIIKSAQKELSDGVFVISDACGDTSDTEPTSFPVTKIITYTIR